MTKKKGVNTELQKLLDENNFNKMYLDKLYQEALDNNVELWPDDAIKKLLAFWYERLEKDGNRSELESKVSIANPQLDLMAEVRKIHIYAVNLFYSTYYPRKGAPKILEKHGDYLLKLRAEGHSYRDIALILEPHLKTAEEIGRAEGKIRKRIKAFEKRKS